MKRIVNKKKTGENIKKLCESHGITLIDLQGICKEIMPTEKPCEIGSIKPTGWNSVKYDCVDGKYLYNRCHLIGYQLAGENANEKNLITGTRYLLDFSYGTCYTIDNQIILMEWRISECTK